MLVLGIGSGVAVQGVPASARLFAGTINGAGQLDLQVTWSSSQSTLSKLAAMVEEAKTQPSPTQRFTDRFERIFVPAVLALVVVVLLVGPLASSSCPESFYRAMAVLAAASPCALAIATPSAVPAAVASAGRMGVLIKGGGPLENLGTVKAMAFDKTGTLTQGRPRSLMSCRPPVSTGMNSCPLPSPWSPSTTIPWPKRSYATPENCTLKSRHQRPVSSRSLVAGCGSSSTAHGC